MTKKPMLRKQSVAGFTLIETLVVIVIAGILAAIMAPSWIAFINRQRVNSVRNEVYQAIQKAQNQARQTHSTRKVEFKNEGGFPKLAIQGTWRTLGQGQIKSGATQLSLLPNTVNSIIFDDKGAVANLATASGTTQELSSTGFTIVVSVSNSSGIKGCVKVRTILGAMQEANGSDCNS